MRGGLGERLGEAETALEPGVGAEMARCFRLAMPKTSRWLGRLVQSDRLGPDRLCFYLDERFFEAGRVGERGHLAGVDHEVVADDGVLILEEAALGWARGARSVHVVGAAVAGAHEELGLCEPAHGAAEMCAVDGEDLELIGLNVAHPAGNIGGFAVGVGPVRVAIVDQPGFSFGEVD